MKSLLVLLCSLLALRFGHAASTTPPPDPGPESGSLRLRLVVTPRADTGKEGYDVRIDMVNISKKAITIRAAWRSDEEHGKVSEYLEAATSIECSPAVAPWMGGVQESHRKAPQPEQVLEAGATLSARWQTEGRQLKNRVTNPNEVQNPKFPFPGLYAVHATLDVITGETTVRLRSNEQLVSVGGSTAMPKPSVGRLGSVDETEKTAVLMLGSLEQVQVGDEFEIGHPKGMHWKLTIDRVDRNYSFGKLELLTKSAYPPFSKSPTPQMDAVLVPRK